MDMRIPLFKILGKMPCDEGLSTLTQYSDGLEIDLAALPNSLLTHKIWAYQFIDGVDILGDLEAYCGYGSGELIQISLTVPLITLTEATYKNYRLLIDRIKYWESK